MERSVTCGWQAEGTVLDGGGAAAQGSSNNGWYSSPGDGELAQALSWTNQPIPQPAKPSLLQTHIVACDPATLFIGRRLHSCSVNLRTVRTGHGALETTSCAVA
jgi:hypothetical protein